MRISSKVDQNDATRLDLGRVVVVRPDLGQVITARPDQGQDVVDGPGLGWDVATGLGPGWGVVAGSGPDRDITAGAASCLRVGATGPGCRVHFDVEMGHHKLNQKTGVRAELG
jgi:hypothetical protein